MVAPVRGAISNMMPKRSARFFWIPFTKMRARNIKLAVDEQGNKNVGDFDETFPNDQTRRHNENVFANVRFSFYPESSNPSSYEKSYTVSWREDESESQAQEIRRI